ncbi:MAG: hypothetical protein ACLFUI_07995, partial [Halanaerobiales bacterium]
MFRKKLFVLSLVTVMVLVLTGNIVADEGNGINILGNSGFDNPLSTEQPDSEGVIDTEGSWSLFLNNGEGAAES